MLFEIIIIAAVIIFDLITKVVAADLLPALGGSFEFIPGVVSFTYAENTGAAFSMFSGSPYILGIVSIAVSAALFVVMLKTNKYKSRLLGLALCFIIGGGIGNVIDRFALGYVRDMIEFTFVDFAIFNVADSFACIGAVMLGIFIIFYWDKAKKKYELSLKETK